MKFTVDRATLLNELAYLQGAVEKKQVIQILSYLLIEASPGKLSLRATDLNLTIATECEAEVTQSGAVCLPARKLLEIVKSLPPAEIECKVSKQGQAEIKCAGSRFKLAGLDVADYPELPQFEGAYTEIAGELFARFIPRILHALTQEESRYALQGAKMEISKDRFRLVATDGHRLALAEREGTFVEGLETDVIVPKKALVELAKLSAETDEPVRVGVGENHLFAQLGQRQLISRLLTGAFPDYTRVIPTENPHHLMLDCAVVAPAIRRVALMAEQRSHSVKLDFGEGQLLLTASDDGAGEANDALTVDYCGEAVSIGFNALYLNDFFNAVEEEQVACALKDGQSQALFSVELGAQERFQEVLMPLRF